MQQSYWRTPMPKFDFNKVALRLYQNRTSARVFSCKFVAYLYEHLFIRTLLQGCFCFLAIEKSIQFLLWLFYHILDSIASAFCWFLFATFNPLLLLNVFPTFFMVLVFHGPGPGFRSSRFFYENQGQAFWKIKIIKCQNEFIYYCFKIPGIN